MAIFRADHYVIAEFKEASTAKEAGEKVLQALKEVPELKDLAVVTKRLEGKQWAEIVGRIDVPEGSRAFWAMIKKEVTDREPYNLFVRLDRNAEAPDMSAARAIVKSWAESSVVPKITSKVAVKTIRVVLPNEIYMPQLK